MMSAGAFRVVVFLLVLTAAFALGMTVQAFAGNARAELAANGGTAEGAAQAAFVTVMPGDTLWELAAQHAPAGSDLQKYVYELKRVNRLKSGAIHAGQILRLPD